MSGTISRNVMKKEEVMPEKKLFRTYLEDRAQACRARDKIAKEEFERQGVKRGLRDLDGKGVLTGLTNISRIDAFETVDGQSVPCEGKLWYRGYNIYDIVQGFEGRRFGFEETAYLLVFGELPTPEELIQFKEVLAQSGALPRNFTRDVVMKAPTHDLMNSLTKSILTLASYDHDLEDSSLPAVLGQCLKLISVFPALSVYAYQAYMYSKNHSLYIHRPKAELSTAENILRMLRPDMAYTPLEAEALDIALVLHMEHGGGNNSTFTTRVVTSSGSDTYSVMAAALSSLKGPRHGGANIKVVQMMGDIARHIPASQKEEAVRAYLMKILEKEAFDRSGLIYGMGHAVYSLSDPRANILKEMAERLAHEKGKEKELALYLAVEKLGPEVIAQKRHIYKGVCINVDFFSGLVYSMLGIPTELYTPIFAIARIVGWSAHRMEELINMDKIIRPAYRSVLEPRAYPADR